MKTRTLHSIKVRVLKELWQSYHSLPKWKQFDRWLDGTFRRNPAFGKRDRRWYAEYLFAGLRFADLAFQVLGEKPISKWNELEIKSRFLKHNSDEFWSLIEQRMDIAEPYFRASSDQMSERLFEWKENPYLWSGIPKFWEPFFEERFRRSKLSADERALYLKRMGEKAPLWIRLQKLDRKEDLLADLRRENLEILEDTGEALRIQGNKSLYALETFAGGLFEVQDLASQRILSAVDFRGVKKVWDVCAGAGGKTLQLSSLMRNKGVLFASDIRAYKLEELRRRAKRDDVQNLRTFEWNGEELDWAKFPEIKSGDVFDLVLVDAPCSSSGVMRRNPELRFRLNPNQISDFTALQIKLLNSAAKATRVGGHLCYGTCSFLVEENEKLVEAFSKSNPTFTLCHEQPHGLPGSDSDATFSALWRREELRA